jgi:crotonobetainyl-CoA:carnitine CoA-transferase CaiB-like acyl-CoA transferase
VVAEPDSPYWSLLAEVRATGDDLPQLHGLVHVLISPFGQLGLKPDAKARHLNTFHAGGEGYLLPGGLGFSMFPDRPPLQAGGKIGEYDAGLAAATAALGAALFERADRPQVVDVSKQDVQVTLGRQYVTTLDSAGVVESRASRAYSAAGLFECSDGWAFIYASEDHFWRGLATLIGRTEWLEDPRFRTRPARTANWAEAEPDVIAWALSHTQAEVERACRDVGVPASAYKTAADVLDSPSLRDRDFFTTLAHPTAGEMDYPGLGFTFSGAETGPRSAAPEPGADNADVYGEKIGISDHDLELLRRSGVV